MVEAFALVIGGGVLVLGILALALGSGLSLTMWETWWLHPLWALVMVPLGLPAISYWHLFGINVFWSVLLIAPAYMDYAKEEDKTTLNVSRAGRVVVAFLRPVVAYYIVRWAF